ncbi:predicted hydrolase of the metallo-beta-lactamase superfamily [Acidaminococcus sp. CAG:917]|nr:predicted hydrolase of the metallo-beta-lactamase superfamily [Acidaminococcus sp. CAG:917]
MAKKQVKIIFLGGVGEIGKNMTALEYGNDIIIVDCGVTFPDESTPGIDSIIPDTTYISDNINKLRGIVLTHGHEDHIGALQYLADEFNVPIYGTALTLGILEHKLGFRHVRANLKTVEPGDRVKLGCFDVEFIKVAHSMAGACALSIETPVGVVFFTGDFKIDSTPIDGKLTNLQRIAEIGAKGVLVMLGESTNIERKGHSTSEKVVGQNLDTILNNNRERRITIATFASSNYRVQQILNLAQKYGRKVILSGRSMKMIVEVGAKVGELKIPKNVIVDSPGKLPYSQQLIIATGTQGEPMSALTRLSQGEFNKIALGENDLVVLSSSPIPGNDKYIYRVINNLFKCGAEVIYDAMNDVHVSGHAYEEELKIMLSLVRPKFFLPVHGEYRHQVKHVMLAEALGVPKANIAIPEIGQVWGFNQSEMKRHPNVPSGSIFVDGEMLDDGKSVINERRHLAENGLIVLLVSIDFKAERLSAPCDVVTRGFGITDETESVIKRLVDKTVSELDFSALDDRSELPKLIRKPIKNYFAKDRQFPVIMPIVLED